MTSGSVRPCPTRVTRITVNVRNRIRSRPGNVPPASVWSGSASAAASDTAPRIPAQERKTASRQLSTRSATAGGVSSTTKTHAKRTAITVSSTSAA